MKRLCALFAALSLLPLGGCGLDGGIYSNYRSIEQLQLVRTLGVDFDGDGLALSAAAGRPQSGKPLLLSARAAGLAAGTHALQAQTPRGELFFAHTQYLVLGQAFAGRGVAELLDYVERDVCTRMGAGLFVVRGGSARSLIAGAGEDWDVNDVLTSLKAETDRRGDSHVFDVRETAVALSESGAALICAIRAVDTEGSVFGLSPGVSAVPDGYGILKNGALCGFLGGKQAQAASLMLGKLGAVTRSFPDGAGGAVTLELRCGAPDLHFSRRPDGGLTLSVRIAPEAMIAAPGSDRLDTAALTAAVNAALTEELTRLLRRSQAENADFLALGRALRLQGVDPASLPADWLQNLTWEVTVETSIRHSYDLRERAGTDGGGAP